MFDFPPEMDNNPSAIVQIAEKKNSQFKTKGIVKIPKKTDEEKTYEQLTRSKKDEKVIYELISTMAQKGKINLLFIKHHMEDLGDQISHVHPLKMLGYIYSNKELKEQMKMILNDHFKKGHFIDGLTPPLNNDVRRGKLKDYLQDFCDEVGVKPHQVQPYFNRRDWEGLLHFLANN